MRLTFSFGIQVAGIAVKVHLRAASRLAFCAGMAVPIRVTDATIVAAAARILGTSDETAAAGIINRQHDSSAFARKIERAGLRWSVHIMV
jgi:hypothetical protein